MKKNLEKFIDSWRKAAFRHARKTLAPATPEAAAEEEKRWESEWRRFAELGKSFGKKAWRAPAELMFDWEAWSNIRCGLRIQICQEFRIRHGGGPDWPATARRRLRRMIATLRRCDRQEFLEVTGVMLYR